MDLSKYLDLFVEEASQNYDALQASLAHLQECPSKTELEQAILAAHTLKGLCATMQYETMSTIAMFMEEYLRLLEPKLDQLEGKRPFEPLATAARVFKNLLNDVVTGEQPSLTSLEFLDELARV